MVELCPVCGGRGITKNTFYDSYAFDSTAAPYDVPCRSCGGCGIFVTEPHGAFPITRWVVKDGELRPCVDVSPLGMRPLAKDSGLFNLAASE